MPRSGRLRSFIREYNESPRAGKISVIPPFLILAIEIVLITHAVNLPKNPESFLVVQLTLILAAVSIIEIVIVSREIHERRQQNNFDRVLTIKLDGFITEGKGSNVKMIVLNFIEKHPSYNKYRGQVYRLSCQILETHKEESIEKEYSKTLKKIIKKSKEKNVDDLLKSFIKKYPKYKKYRGEIYEKICRIRGSMKD